MQKQKRACFYFVNTTDIQEYTGLIIECIRADLFVDILVFDITSKKRNFYYYTTTDFENYFDNLLSINGLKKNYSVKKYTHKDQQKFFKDYDRSRPDLIFTRNVSKLKYAQWMPVVEMNKTVLFVWEHPETMQEYKNLLTISRYKDGDIGFVNNDTIHVPGKLRYVGDNHHPHLNKDIVDFCDNEKTCFIPETWARNLEDKKNNLPLVLDIVKSLKSMGFHIAWKIREKGYPAQSEYSKNYVREVESFVDLIITKDLNYPSSLYYLMKNCDMTCILNVTSTTMDAMHLSKNPFVFLSKHLSDRYRSKLSADSALSWGGLYENLADNVNLYDEKYNTLSVKDFLTMHENFKRELLPLDDSQQPHRDLVVKLLQKKVY